MVTLQRAWGWVALCMEELRSERLFRTGLGNEWPGALVSAFTALYPERQENRRVTVTQL